MWNQTADGEKRNAHPDPLGPHHSADLLPMPASLQVRGAARQVFASQLDRMHLLAMRAVLQTNRGPQAEALGRIDADLRQVEKKQTALYAEWGSRLPVTRLLDRLKLSPDDIDLLWATVALTVDPRIGSHAQVLVGGDARHGLSIALLTLLLQLPSERSSLLALSLQRSHPLLHFRLIVPTLSGALPANQTYAAALRTASFLAGDDQIDPDLASCGSLRTGEPWGFFDATQQGVIDRLRQALASTHHPLLIVDGGTASGRSMAVALAAARPTATLNLRRVPAASQESMFAALRRECLLSDALPLLEEVDSIAGPDEPSRLRALAAWIDETPGPVVLTTLQQGLHLPCQRLTIRLSWPLPDVATRALIWQAMLPVSLRSAAVAQDLAQRFQLAASGIQAALRATQLTQAAPEGAPLTVAEVIGGIRASVSERFSGLAQRVLVRPSWDDLVLPEDTMAQVKELVARMRFAHKVYEQWGFRDKVARATGVAALFSGLPGTGKSLVAGLIAKELGLDLYQVDLSSVISKWVGETEKQLARLFEAAEVGHSLLLFDEADSLFSRRTEVKGAHDRYANLEVNYLLQRIETFSGSVILTTNFGTAIDPAFLRRLSAHVQFWPPDQDERARLWRSMLPKSAPIQRPLQIHVLVQRFPEMSGANIRNAILAAAFRAATESAPIAQRHLEEAAQAEYVAMGRV